MWYCKVGQWELGVCALDSRRRHGVHSKPGCNHKSERHHHDQGQALSVLQQLVALPAQDSQQAGPRPLRGHQHRCLQSRVTQQPGGGSGRGVWVAGGRRTVAVQHQCCCSPGQACGVECGQEEGRVGRGRRLQGCQQAALLCQGRGRLGSGRCSCHGLAGRSRHCCRLGGKLLDCLSLWSNHHSILLPSRGRGRGLHSHNSLRRLLCSAAAPELRHTRRRPWLRPCRWREAQQQHHQRGPCRSRAPGHCCAWRTGRGGRELDRGPPPRPAS